MQHKLIYILALYLIFFVGFYISGRIQLPVYFRIGDKSLKSIEPRNRRKFKFATSNDRKLVWWR